MRCSDLNVRKHDMTLLFEGTFVYHIYPVPFLLQRKSTLYPSFLLSSFIFFLLRDMLLLCVCCCLNLLRHGLMSFFLPVSFTDIIIIIIIDCCSYYCCRSPVLAFFFYPDFSCSLSRAVTFFPTLFFSFLLLSHHLLYSTCSVLEFVVRSFYLLYFTFRVGQ